MWCRDRVLLAFAWDRSNLYMVPGVLFVMLWFFGMGMLGVTMLLQNFFRNSSLIAMVVPFVFFIPTGVALTIILGPIISNEANNWVQYLFWFPTFPFSVAAVDLLDKSEIVYFEVDVAVAWVFLVI